MTWLFLREIHVQDDHGYVPLVAIKSRYFLVYRYLRFYYYRGSITLLEDY